MTGNKNVLPTGRKNKKPVVLEWVFAQTFLVNDLTKIREGGGSSSELKLSS